MSKHGFLKTFPEDEFFVKLTPELLSIIKLDIPSLPLGELLSQLVLLTGELLHSISIFVKELIKFDELKRICLGNCFFILFF